ncbi:MAG: ribonuclease HIII [Erysipelotrichaceae bacterium]
MQSYTLTMNPQEIQALYTKLAPTATKKKTPPYALYQIALVGCTITAYQSGKVVFQGEDAAFYAEGMKHKASVPKGNTAPQYAFPMSGSDEVGTGDYFGPVVVVACTVSQALYETLKDLEIQDSKKMNDATILQLVPTILSKIPHSKLILDPHKYNQVHLTTNMNAIKAKMHNQAYLHLAKKLNAYPPNIIIDQFCAPNLYFRYLQHDPEVVQTIHFETKAESKYFAVALASVLARYYFLLAFQAMCERYDFPFKKGASAQVDEQIRQYVERHGVAALDAVAKTHYANTKKALGD